MGTRLADNIVTGGERRTAQRARPFLKWAGGKGQLVAEIARRLPPPDTLVRYVEPFVGGGAFFFWMRENHPDLRCRIADRNVPLIDTYLAVRDAVEELITALRPHAEKHSSNHYYAVRRLQPTDPVERAARFIYLNRTCYNGLWRVNRGGNFNVPLGRYQNPRIIDEENLRRASRALQGVEVLCVDFEEAVRDLGSGDLVYFDPPYQPLSQTSYFTAYTSNGFDGEEQARLARVFQRLRRRGAFAILSNSDAEPVRRLYQRLLPQPVLSRVRVPRAINSKGRGRGAINELLICSAR